LEETDAEVLRQIALGLKEGAEQAGVEIPVATRPAAGADPRHPSRAASTWWRLLRLGRARPDVTGERIEAGDALIASPQRLHSNGLTSLAAC